MRSVGLSFMATLALPRMGALAWTPCRGVSISHRRPAKLNGQPVTIHCSEHFRSRHAGLSCSGAPIFDGDGRIAGLIDVSSFDRNVSDRAHTMTGGLTIAVARGIGERLFRAKFRGTG